MTLSKLLSFWGFDLPCILKNLYLTLPIVLRSFRVFVVQEIRSDA